MSGANNGQQDKGGWQKLSSWHYLINNIIELINNMIGAGVGVGMLRGGEIPLATQPHSLIAT